MWVGFLFGGSPASVRFKLWDGLCGFGASCAESLWLSVKPATHVALRRPRRSLLFIVRERKARGFPHARQSRRSQSYFQNLIASPNTGPARAVSRETRPCCNQRSNNG